MYLSWIKDNLPFIESSFKMLLESVLILTIGWWISGIIARPIKKMMLKAKFDEGMISFIMSILKTVLSVIVILSAIDHMKIPIAPLLTALGAAAVTAGLALKDSLSNVASGVLIVINRMFRVGDDLKVEGYEGEVRKIEIFFTTLITGDNKQILIPNSKITSNSIVNYTACDKRRIDLSYYVDCGLDLHIVKNVIREVIKGNPDFLSDPEPLIEMNDYKENGMNVVVRVWCKTKNYSNLYFYMQSEIKKSFDINGINVPSNRIDVNLLGGDKNGV